jgi:hypothetical protein
MATPDTPARLATPRHNAPPRKKHIDRRILCTLSLLKSYESVSVYDSADP